MGSAVRMGRRNFFAGRLNGSRTAQLRFYKRPLSVTGRD
jgi:hypothetical protein